MVDEDFIRGHRMKKNIDINIYDDFLTQQQIDEILPPFDIDEMQEVANLIAAYSASLNE